MQARRNEIVWHTLYHGTPIFILMVSFFQDKYPKLVYVVYYLLVLIKNAFHILLRHRQIKNGSYIMVNPVYMVPLACATHLMSTNSTAYFIVSNLALFLIFEANLVFTILYVYNPLL